MPESVPDRYEDRLEQIDGVERAKLVDGRKDYIAGQRDVDRMYFDVELEDDVVEQVEEELEPREIGELTFSDTLRGVHNELEENGFAVGDNWRSRPEDHDRGVIGVTGLYDNRPGGSDVRR